MAKILKTIHAQKSNRVAREKDKAVGAQLRKIKLKKAAKNVEGRVKEALTCYFPYEH